MLRLFIPMKRDFKVGSKSIREHNLADNKKNQSDLDGNVNISYETNCNCMPVVGEEEEEVAVNIRIY